MTLPARKVPAFCQTCRSVTPHLLATCTITCPGCGQARIVSEEFEAFGAVLAGTPVVEAVTYCHRCRQTVGPGHDCVYDPTPCERRREDGTVCGICPTCLEAMHNELRRFAVDELGWRDTSHEGRGDLG